MEKADRNGSALGNATTFETDYRYLPGFAGLESGLVSSSTEWL